MNHPLNDGSRPSWLALGRALTGETPPLEGPAMEALRAEAAAAPVPPFDAAALRARAAALPDVTAEVPRQPAPANTAWGRWLVPFAALAAAVLFFVAVPEPVNRWKGDDDLGFYLLRGDNVYMGDPEATVRAGDRLQFSYYTRADRLVLLSVDGTGRLTVFYPAQGDEGVEVIPGERHVLDGSVELDDAPGPEVFVACFGDISAATCADLAEDAWLTGGTAALVGLPDQHDHVSVLALEKE